MSFILIISVVIRLAAFGWSILLLRQLRDWRMAFLSGMLVLMALRQILTMISERESWEIVFHGHIEELPGLAVSVVAFFAVFYLKNVLTEHDRAVAEHRKSESRLASILDIAADAIITADKEQHILQFNQGAEQIFGYRAEEVLGQPLDILLPSRFVTAHQQHIHTFATSLKSTHRMGELSQDVFGRRKDGSEFPADASISKLSMDNQITFTVILRDITERKRAEEHIQYLRGVLESIRNVNQLIVHEKNKQQLLQGACDIINQTRHYRLVWIGMLKEGSKDVLPVAQAGHEDGYLKSVKVTFDDSETGKGPTGMSIKTKIPSVMRNIAGDSRYKPWRKQALKYGYASSVSTPLVHEDRVFGALNVYSTIPDAFDEEEVQLLVEVSQDIGFALHGIELEEKRTRAEEALYKVHEELEVKVMERTSQLAQANLRLQELDQLKSMFIASMSHELRTPLNSIIGFSGVILQGIAGEVTEEQRKQLRIVKRSAYHLLDLINDIIDVSKIEAEKVELSIEHFDLPSLVREVKESFTLAAQEHGLALVLSTPDNLTIESDKRRVRQILANIVNNALKFTDQGKVEIKVIKKGGVVKVLVMDTGIGIREKDMGRLLKAFSRIRTEGRIREGSGLGLYLSMKIADLLGGGISVESEFGKGSTFTFTLPLHRRST